MDFRKPVTRRDRRIGAAAGLHPLQWSHRPQGGRSRCTVTASKTKPLQVTFACRTTAIRRLSGRPHYASAAQYDLGPSPLTGKVGRNQITRFTDKLLRCLDGEESAVARRGWPSGIMLILPRLPPGLFPASCARGVLRTIPISPPHR